MKNLDLAKALLLAVLTIGFAVGCATTEEPADPVATGADSGPSPAAKNAIYSAKLANAKAARLGYEWRDTGKMIQEAEKAAAAGDNDKAIAMATTAREQAEAAVDQYYREQERLKTLEMEGHPLFADSSGAMAGSMGMMDTYSVMRGDSLWTISAKDEIYGNPYQWPLIFKANSGKINDPDLIFPGQQFDIMRGASASEVDRAVRHARTRGAWSVGEMEDSDRIYLGR